MTDIQSYRSILDLVDEYRSIYIHQLKSLNELIDIFSKCYDEARSKQPVRFSLLDFVPKIRETSHSKLLAELLRDKRLLTSYIGVLNGEGDFYFPETCLGTPLVVAEKSHIDICIREENSYCIIIENKINKAEDQPNQLARYIDTARQWGYDLDQIYILYLSLRGDKEQDPNTWRRNSEAQHKLDKDREQYCPQKDFPLRYKHISYQKHILPWLENVINNATIIPQEPMLWSGIVQYIDRIKTDLDINEYNKAMNQEVQNSLREAIGLNSLTPEQQLKALENKLADMDELKKHLETLKKQVYEQLFADWQNKLKESHDLNFYYKEDQNKYLLQLYKTIDQEDVKFSIIIECDWRNNHLYYGLGRHYASSTLDDKVEQYIKSRKLSRDYEMREYDFWWYRRRDESPNQIVTELVRLYQDIAPCRQ